MTPEADYLRAYRNAVIARQLDAWFLAASDMTLPEPDHYEQYTVREAAMADNLRWVVEREGPEGRVLLYTHNWHVKKSAMHWEAHLSSFQINPEQP